MKRDYMYISQSSYEVIDNFLPQKEFQEIQATIMGESGKSIGWVYNTSITHENKETTWKHFYMTHMVCQSSVITSPLICKSILPVLEKIDAKALIRIKINLFPNSEKIHENKMHADMSFSHRGALFSINTCDGYTKLKDGTKIDSVANRILLFDPSMLHCSTNTSDTTARFNIQINYF